MSGAVVNIAFQHVYSLRFYCTYSNKQVIATLSKLHLVPCHHCGISALLFALCVEHAMHWACREEAEEDRSNATINDTKTWWRTLSLVFFGLGAVQGKLYINFVYGASMQNSDVRSHVMEAAQPSAISSTDSDKTQPNWWIGWPPAVSNNYKWEKSTTDCGPYCFYKL